MTWTEHTVFVPGKPEPQGSAKAYRVGNRAVVTHDNERVMPWRAVVAAHLHSPGGILHPTGPVGVEITFVMPRRKAEPKRDKPAHTRRPDIDKLLRAILDAMTGVVYADDSQVTHVSATKYTADDGEVPGVRISWGGVERPTAPTVRVQADVAGAIAAMRGAR